MRSHLRLLLAGLALLLVALPAAAQNDPKTGEVGLDLVGSALSGLPYDDPAGGRFRVGFSLSRRIGMEFRYAFASTQASETGEDVDAQTWGLHVLWNFRPKEKARPFAVVGLTRTDFTGIHLDPPDTEGIEVGGGWRHWFNKRFAGRAEGSLVLRGEDNNWGDALMVEDVDFQLAAGVSISLGKKENMTWEPKAPREKKEKAEPKEGKEEGAEKAAEPPKAEPEKKPEVQPRPAAPPPPAPEPKEKEYDPKEGIERKPPRK